MDSVSAAMSRHNRWAMPMGGTGHEPSAMGLGPLPMAMWESCVGRHGFTCHSKLVRLLDGSMEIGCGSVCDERSDSKVDAQTLRLNSWNESQDKNLDWALSITRLGDF